MVIAAARACAAVLWNEPGEVLVHDSGPGRDILNGALKRDDSSKDTLYFRFRVSPLSDATTEEYYAGFELFDGGVERLGVGNALAAYAYSAFFRMRESEGANPVGEYVDLHSSNVEPAASGAVSSYELPRRGQERTIIFKVQYVPNGDDLVTVWLNPDLSAGATEIQQPETLITRFSANVSFDEVRLRHAGRGDGWVFSEVAIATAFADFVDPSRARFPALDSGRFFERQPFEFDAWLRDPGMPRVPIRALAQTSDGYLWLAGGSQLTRFDGVRFVAVSLPGERGSDAITTLFGDSYGALWIGTSNRGLVRYSGAQFDTFTGEQGLPADNVTVIAGGKDSALWIGTAAGVAAWEHGTIHKVKGLESLDGCDIRSLLQEDTGALWIVAAQKGVLRFQDGVLSRVTDSQVNELLPDARCVSCDPSGRLWIASGGDFVLCRDKTEWHRYRIPRAGAASSVSALGATADGTIWAASTGEGLFRIKQGKLAALNSNGGLAENQPAALLVDREGNLWVGGSAGLHRLRRKSCFELGQAEGLGHGIVTGLAEVSPGVIWAIQPGRGVYRWEGDTFRRLSAFGLSPADPAVGAMLVTRDRACWVACTNGLLLFRDPQAVADESQLFELPHAGITALAEAPDGSIWAGTREGQLWQLQQGQWRLHDQLASRFGITVLEAEPKGNLWVGTDGGGLYLVEPSGETHAYRQNGFAADYVRALYRDESDTLWVGTEGSGLISISNQCCARSANAISLPDTRVLGILEDRAGRLWLNTGAGLACIAKPPLAGRAVELQGMYTLGTATEDLSDRGSSCQFLPHVRDSVTGRLWFATFDGIVLVDPQSIATNAPAAALIVEEVLVDGMPAPGFNPLTSQTGLPANGLTQAASLRIGPGRHRLDFRYTCPQFTAPEKMRFRYWLQGLDQNWIEAGNNRVAQYSYMPPGDYQFTVGLYRQNGRFEQATVGLSVSPHFWQRRSVIAGAALGLLAAITGSVRLAENRRMKRRLGRLEQQNLLERERMRIARDLHDEMGAKLCRISFLSEHAKRFEPGSGQITEQVATIAHDSRALLHSLDEIVWAVNPRNDTLEHVGSYLGQYAQEYFQSTGITCVLDIPSDLPQVPVASQSRHHLFLAVQEALANVLKHSGATQVKVTVSAKDRVLRTQVEDNGRGIVPPASPIPSTNGEATGNGIHNMRQRIADVGGQCSIDSVPGRGTLVQFDLRISIQDAAYDHRVHS